VVRAVDLDEHAAGRVCKIDAAGPPRHAHLWAQAGTQARGTHSSKHPALQGCGPRPLPRCPQRLVRRAIAAHQVEGAADSAGGAQAKVLAAAEAVVQLHPFGVLADRHAGPTLHQHKRTVTANPQPWVAGVQERGEMQGADQCRPPHRLMPLPLRAQVGGGERAVHTSSQEWEQCVLKALAYELDQAGITNPIVSFDHATIHSPEAFQRAFAGWTGRRSAERMPLAPRMPDGNKVVEHVFPHLKRAFFAKVIARRGRRITPRGAQTMLIEAFTECVKAESILLDAKSLPLTMKIISTRAGDVFPWGNGQSYEGTGGGWPPARHR